MKKLTALTMIFVLLCCMFAGCHKDAPETTGKPKPAPTDPPRATVEQYTPYLKLGKTGKLRIPYTINLSNAKYITSVDMLPDEECFAAYDEAYFRENALLIVTETVKSGSVDVKIESVKVDDNTASVKLTHTGAGGIGTGDMAVWLLWAEVEKGLEYDWVVENPSIESNTSQS